MDNSDPSHTHHSSHLGVNKMSRNIRKSPSIQPNFANTKPQPQPHVYNISKRDFRSVVQQLTGSPSHERQQNTPPAPLQNPPKSQSQRLQRIRPPPLTPIARPPLIPSIQGPFSNGIPIMYPGPRSPFASRPGEAAFPPLSSIDPHRPQIAESPISAYVRYLQSSITDPGCRPNVPSPSLPYAPSPSSGILPTPASTALLSPQTAGSAPFPSPNSQFLLPSPSFFNMLSPRSPYNLHSPVFQGLSPLTPSFSFLPSPRSSGILGPCPLPSSPGFIMPTSPSGFPPLLSPGWK